MILVLLQGGGVHKGMDVDVCKTATKIGNHTRNLCYTVTKNNETIEYWVEIYTPAHETTTYTIEY